MLSLTPALRQREISPQPCNRGKPYSSLVAATKIIGEVRTLDWTYILALPLWLEICPWGLDLQLRRSQKQLGIESGDQSSREITFGPEARVTTLKT